VVKIQPTAETASSPIASGNTPKETAWHATYLQFLAAVAPTQREQVASRLRLHSSGSGLRDWIDAITWRGGVLPCRIPESVVDVYLTDPEASPLYDCEGCGLAIPVRPSRLYGFEGEPEVVYFSKCPICDSRTGLFLHFTRCFESQAINPLRRVPR
jgi:hypothetical protein